MGRRPKKYTPWEDKVETHPFSYFPKESKDSEKLILGSFPPNKFTTHKEKVEVGDMAFFYGSKKNKFWDLFGDAMSENFNLPIGLSELKDYLIYNKWCISDIVAECQRKKDSACDSDLINIQWNIEVINFLIQKNHISSIFFTSKWVEDHYKKHLKKYINDDNIVEYFLLSPSPNGLRTAGIMKDLAIEIKNGETNTDFRIRYYNTILSPFK